MKESKAMLEIREIRDQNAEEIKNLSLKDKIDYLFKKGEQARKNLNLEPKVSSNYHISQKDLYNGAVSEETTKYITKKEPDEFN